MLLFSLFHMTLSPLGFSVYLIGGSIPSPSPRSLWANLIDLLYFLMLVGFNIIEKIYCYAHTAVIEYNLILQILI